MQLPMPERFPVQQANASLKRERIMSDPFSKVLDLARKVNGGTDQEFTGEFHPDQEAVEAWRTPLSQEDNGEFRYGNKSPMELRRMIEVEADPVEKGQMERILNMFIARGLAIDEDDPRATRAGEPYRGEKRGDVRPESISALGESVRPVGHVSGGKEGRHLSDDVKNGDGLGMIEGPGGVWEEV